jgi:hypothetical protein
MLSPHTVRDPDMVAYLLYMVLACAIVTQRMQIYGLRHNAISWPSADITFPLYSRQKLLRTTTNDSPLICNSIWIQKTPTPNIYFIC